MNIKLSDILNQRVVNCYNELLSCKEFENNKHIVKVYKGKKTGKVIVGFRRGDDDMRITFDPIKKVSMDDRRRFIFLCQDNLFLKYLPQNFYAYLFDVSISTISRDLGFGM